MILQALAEMAEREGLLEDPSYEQKEVHYLIRLGPGGKYLSCSAPRDEPPLDSKGKPRGSPRPKKRPIPKRSDRRSQAQAEFLVDKAEYVFGIDPAGNRPKAELVERKNLFVSFIDSAIQKAPMSAGLRAVRAFLDETPPRDLQNLFVAESASQRAAANSLFAFVYEPDGGVNCVHDEPAIKAFFTDWFAEHGQMRTGKSHAGRREVARGQCLVTGKQDVQLAELHPKPKGIPPVRVTGRGAPLTSTNLPAFESYRLGKIGCAPVSREVARAVEVALTRLLDPAYPGADGLPLPSRKILLKNDTVLIFWSPDEGNVDFVAGIDDADPEKVRELLHSPVGGRRAPLGDASRFYALVLTGTTGRAIVRSLIESTVGDVASNVERYFREADIVRPFGKGRGTYPLKRLRQALAAFGELDRLPPQQGTELYLAILLGRPFPRSLLETTVRRNRVDLSTAEVFAARCSLLKAYFCRNLKEGIAMSLDPQRGDPPYLLGRLLATIDKVQGEALGDINATIVDRFYGSASSTPAAIFPTLIRRAQHHFGKLRREKTGLGVIREKLIQEISAGLRDFPRVLDLESQGLFALGFYHQRQAFFTKAED
jgi:CRISPR-associated protein Csd1